jgi:hypothetical protein
VTILAMIKEALRIGRTHKSLWLFGFFCGLGGGFNFGGGGGGQGGGAEVDVVLPAPLVVPGLPPDPARVTLVIITVLAIIAVFVVLKSLATGALIEGVKRARSNGSMSMGEGFREGWAHWGVLFRLAVLYFLANAVSVAVLGGGALLVGRAFGGPALFVSGGLAALIGVPWLVTLYMWQAFAERIAVLENRRALDAIAKARLFLHGRLKLGLKLLVAGFLGVLAISAIGGVVLLPLGAFVFFSSALWGPIGAGLLGALTLLPAAFVVIAMIGIMTSSVWTIGYLTQVEQ